MNVQSRLLICLCLVLNTWNSHNALAAPFISNSHSTAVSDNTTSSDDSSNGQFPKLPPPPKDLPHLPSEAGGQLKIPPPPRSTLLQLKVNSSTLSNANVASDDANGSIVFVNGAEFLLTPLRGEKTQLQARAGGSLLRYAEGGGGYNSLDLGLSIRQSLGKKTYAEIGWLRRDLEGIEDFDDLIDNSIGLTLNHQEPITKRLRFRSRYQLQGHFTDSEDSDRISNRLRLGFDYGLSSKLQLSLDYRLTYSDFTQRDELRTRHQLGTRLIYQASEIIFIGTSLSYLFGEGFNSLGFDSRDLNNLSLGVHLGLNLPLVQN